MVHRASTSDTAVPVDEEKKYLVCHSQLLELFVICPVCSADTSGKISFLRGTAVHVTHKRLWKNQPYIKNMPVLNLQTSAAILFSGVKAAQALRVFQLLNIQGISRSTFFRHQQLYLHPLVFHSWQLEQSRRFDLLKAMPGSLIVSGDGRSDSPGHCAKYGTYTFMEQRMNKVIAIEIVQVRMFLCKGLNSLPT